MHPARLAARAALALALSLAGCGGGAPSPPSLLYSSVAVADLDGDGLPDVIAAYSNLSGPPPHAGFVAVYLQDGANPGHFLAASNYEVGNDPVSVAAGDLDGDGRPDIVTADAILSTNGAGTSAVSVLIQDAAHPGRYLPAVSYLTGVDPHGVAIGDLNGDGKADLAVATSSGIFVLLQNPAGPAGTFLPAASNPIGPTAYSVAIADLDGDGRPDLLATDALNVLVLLQDPAVAGRFAPAVRYAAGQQPIDAVAGDLNGDGKPDIAVANLGSPSDPTTASASVLLQDPSTPGRFLAATNYVTQLRSANVAIADLNADGAADLAVADSGTIGPGCPPDCHSVGTGVSVLLQNPAAPGSFQPAAHYAASAGDFVSWVAVADINGDGKPDLVIAQSGGIYVRLQDPLHPGEFLAATPIWQ